MMTKSQHSFPMNGGARIVVLGAGVLGLTTALQLARRGYYNLAVIARHMPGDNHPDYSSIWAGADWVPVSEEGSEEAGWDVTAWHELLRLANKVPGAGVWLQDRTAYYRNQDLTPDKLDEWFKHLVFDYKILPKTDVPKFADWGTFYRTLSLDPSIYLHYLQSQCLQHGITFHRVACEHIRDAYTAVSEAAPADIVVNCSGLWASKLGGVEDAKMVPVRGQLVIVENDSQGIFSLSGDESMDEDIGERCYVIPRPAGGGTALGGSSYETWSREPDMALAERIMRRSIQVCPHLVPSGAGIEALRVIRHQVGLRPLRKGGPRVESESFPQSEIGGTVRVLRVVHCYGAAGYGFQSSYGMADKAACLVEDCLSGIDQAVV